MRASLGQTSVRPSRATARRIIDLDDSGREPSPRASVLVVDDDDGVRTILSVNLGREGYVVRTARDGAEALRSANENPPDLVVLDIMMPGMDGLTVCRLLRAGPATAHIPILILTAMNRIHEKVDGLSEGADDYMTKPFAVSELLARTGSVIRRSREMRDVNPLTGLPGNLQIERWLQRSIQQGEPIALMYADIDHFKSFNDRYGFLRGDDAIRTLGRILTASAARTGRARVGHVGGDDFVAICHPAVVETICETVLDRFSREGAALYDLADRARGWIETKDRRGHVVRDPLLSVSIGVALSAGHGEDHRRLVAVATEMKRVAKAQLGSACSIDRRSPAADEHTAADGGALDD